ncbi:flavodoxin family protein [Methanobrevibacter olleyae]|uniref:Multimeric flavodoxin WrbA n=1 Tax=Methanobrevibacter olleyae TaxID=294671 RepID=A0A126R294_METOL|nr:NAD(P)H-dependent oxidoreductase [Methanobrevibacter olleyae]AMK16391.1 NADPH-dependent FMN reductase [Methanobrevibacter olleyae]SFL50501.1 Multimeric flavodoxin WrbA [Methanobrevibacter olleyae]
MKYLIINGSPRKKNTWSMAKQAKTNLEGEFEEIQLMKEKIPMCNGCFKCIMEGEENCPHYEIVNSILEKIKWSDGLIITSPVYAMNVTALIKNFFDHTAYLYHRPKFFDKKALVIVSTAGAGQKDVANYIGENLRHWGFNKIYQITYACGGKESINTEEINKVSQKFHKDIVSKKLHAPNIGDLIFYNLWRAMISTKEPIKIDKEYWESTGLVNYEFAPDVNLGFIKKIFAKIMFFILKKVIK